MKKMKMADESMAKKPMAKKMSMPMSKKKK